MVAIRGHIIHPYPFHANSFVTIVLDHHQDRQYAVLIRIQLSERGVGFLGRIVNRGAYRHLFTCLMRRIARRRSELELRPLLFGRRRLVQPAHRRYTHQESQAFENKRHLFPLPRIAVADVSGGFGLFSCPGPAPTSLFYFPAPQIRFFVPPYFQTDCARSHLVARCFRRRSALPAGVSASPPRTVSSCTAVRIHSHSG